MPNSPCGGPTVDLGTDNLTDFHVGGEPISVFLGHVSASWLFRATLNSSAKSNWTKLYPIITQTGLGSYCQPAVTAPESWVGQQGVLGVVADAPDGLLYQCAAVNFVAGSGTQTDTCSNGSDVNAAFASDSSLSALVSTDSSATNGTSTDSSSSTSSGSSSSSGVAPALAPSFSGLAASMAVVTVAGLLGAGLVL
ncbi:hypothetical protein SLS53_004732 [Cytospora paraplurivora]|uniref:Copper acquisition factor BIM1-like domain-containing protein n=1 Tax=Cytospora paraplurivora TaxID=2898453 RepID=A0AAN9YH80_9PEZI